MIRLCYLSVTILVLIVLPVSKVEGSCKKLDLTTNGETNTTEKVEYEGSQPLNFTCYGKGFSTPGEYKLFQKSGIFSKYLESHEKVLEGGLYGIIFTKILTREDHNTYVYCIYEYASEKENDIKKGLVSKQILLQHKDMVNQTELPTSNQDTVKLSIYPARPYGRSYNCGDKVNVTCTSKKITNIEMYKIIGHTYERIDSASSKSLSFVNMTIDKCDNGITFHCRSPRGRDYYTYDNITLRVSLVGKDVDSKDFNCPSTISSCSKIEATDAKNEARTHIIIYNSNISIMDTSKPSQETTTESRSTYTSKPSQETTTESRSTSENTELPPESQSPGIVVYVVPSVVIICILIIGGFFAIRRQRKKRKLAEQVVYAEIDAPTPTNCHINKRAEDKPYASIIGVLRKK